jgi:hypothetical protein
MLSMPVQFVAASSKLAVINEPLVQLELRVQENGAERTVCVEMTPNALNDVIQALEAAASAAQDYSS